MICALTYLFLEMTLQDVRLRLLKLEEAERVSKDLPPGHKVSLTGFLTTGFELEDKQYGSAL